MNIGQAVAALKQGKKITRLGWNSKGMYLFLLSGVPVSPLEVSIAHANSSLEKHLPVIHMVTAEGKVLAGWTASQADILAEDWYLEE